MAHRFHKGVRGDRSEGLAAIRNEETHLPEELRVLQRPHPVRLVRQRGMNQHAVHQTKTIMNNQIPGGRVGLGGILFVNRLGGMSFFYA